MLQHRQAKPATTDLVTAKYRGLMRPGDYVKLSALATINSVASPLTLAAGTLDIQASSPSQEGSMSAAQASKLNNLYNPATHGTEVATDCNAITKSGIYDVLGIVGGAANTPLAVVVWFHVYHHNHVNANNYSTQLAFQLAGDAAGDTRVWRRSNNAGTWSAWRVETYHETAWTALSYGTNWSSYGAGADAYYMRDNAGFVNFKGLVKKSTALAAPEIMFTLPAGFRPGGLEVLHARTLGPGAAECRVDTTGQVTLEAGYSGTPNNWLSLVHFRWKAEN